MKWNFYAQFETPTVHPVQHSIYDNKKSLTHCNKRSIKSMEQTMADWGGSGEIEATRDDSNEEKLFES